MKETNKVIYTDPFEIGFPNNWEIFKTDIQTLCDRQQNNSDKTVDASIKWKNNLFGPIGITFKNKKASAIEASLKTFESDQERSIWLKKNRPLLYCIVDQCNPLCYMEPIKSIEPETIQRTYIVRYFSHAGKLSWFKYNLQFLIGKYNFKHIRPFLYRYLVMD